MKAFIDNNLSEKLANGMKGFGETCIHLKEKFEDDTCDKKWLKYVGKNSLELVTRDNRILKNPAEKNALRSYKVGAFLLGGKQKTRCVIIQQLVRNWPKMKELARITKKPFAFKIPPKGKKITKITI